jgi:hypothetical protein
MSDSTSEICLLSGYPKPNPGWGTKAVVSREGLSAYKHAREVKCGISPERFTNCCYDSLDRWLPYLTERLCYPYP